MNYFLLAETDFFRLINEAGDCNMETAYTAFATQVIELCNGGMDMNLTVIALAYIEIELQHHPVRNLSEEKREIAAMSFTLVSCDDDMDIQQSYPFTVEVMPVPNKVVKGQTVEIRCELKKEGDFSGTLYTIRYFQFEGEGSLKMDNGITFLPNDRYLLENEKFRLYYTAAGDEAHNFIVVVEDNFSNSYELEFDFNNRNVKDDDLTIVPIGNFSPLLK